MTCAGIALGCTPAQATPTAHPSAQPVPDASGFVSVNRQREAYGVTFAVQDCMRTNVSSEKDCLILRARIVNNGEAALSVSVLLSYLASDTQGNRLEPNNESYLLAQRIIAQVDSSAQRLEGEVPVGQSISGWIAWELPKSTRISAVGLTLVPLKTDQVVEVPVGNL